MELNNMKKMTLVLILGLIISSASFADPKMGDRVAYGDLLGTVTGASDGKLEVVLDRGHQVELPPAYFLKVGDEVVSLGESRGTIGKVVSMRMAPSSDRLSSEVRVVGGGRSFVGTLNDFAPVVPPPSKGLQVGDEVAHKSDRNIKGVIQSREIDPFIKGSIRSVSILTEEGLKKLQPQDLLLLSVANNRTATKASPSDKENHREERNGSISAERPVDFDGLPAK